MLLGMRNPTIHAEELRGLVLEAIPALGDALRDVSRTDPHRTTRALFDYAMRAIAAGDTPAFVRCFRLTRRLIELDEQCDGYVRSAVWASYLHRFRHDDPAALEICRGLDPGVREMLYLPFTFPHS